MANILVAIICNLVAAFVLLGCVLSASRNGLVVSIIKVALTLGGAVAAYFLVPVLSGLLTAITVEEIALKTILINMGLSIGTINSVLFLVIFMTIYLINIVICSIVKHCQIKSLRNKKQNTAKIKRARSINPKAERAAKKSAWKALKVEYRAKNTWWKRLISCVLGIIGGLVVGFVVLMPYGYIAKELVEIDAEKAYLVKGYEYTLNGVIGDDICDWIVSNKEEAETPVEPETPSEEVTGEAE